MHSKELYSKEWCDLVFEGRNKDYGAYRIRERAGKRYRRAMSCVVGIVALYVLSTVGMRLFMRYVLKCEMEKATEELSRLRPKDLRDGYEIKFQATARLRLATKRKPGKTDAVPEIVDTPRKPVDMDALGYTGKIDYGFALEPVVPPIVDTIAQNDPKLPEVEERIVPTAAVTNMAQFPGGPRALMKWLDSRIVYPRNCIKAGVEGELELLFIVDETGRVIDPEIRKSFHPDIDRAVLLAARRMPRWKPGTNAQGLPAKTLVTMPVRFEK